MASQEEDNKLECISNVNKEQERYYLNVYKKYESILNDKSEKFEHKVQSLIKVWKSISELNFSQFDIKYIIQIIDWAKLHALNIVLTGEWRSTKENFRDSLLECIEKAQDSLASVNDAFSTRCQKLADVVKKPWEDPVLYNLIQERDAEIGSQEIEFFCVETAYLVSVRLKKLCENHCEDLALNLVTNFLKYKKQATVQNFNLNATETQLWFIFDIYIALLYKFQDRTKILEQFEDLQLQEGVQLIKRFAKKRVKISKIWRNCHKIAIFGSRFFLSKALIKYTDDLKESLTDLLKTYLALSNTETLLQEFVVSVRNLTNLADAEGLCVMCDVIHREAGEKLRHFAIEMYIRALTTDMNELERLKHVNEDDKMKLATARLAHTFSNLADLLDDHVKVARECTLTAFSLEPTRERLKQIEEFAKRSGFPVLDTGQEWKCRLHPPVLPSDELAWVCPECGEWMCKPELTAPVQMNTPLQDALQESVLGISEALCDDLVVCLSNPRYHILSWILAWGDLYRLCILYLNDPEKTKNFVTELKFVDVDYSMFEHIKREPVDEYTGIEKGYEQYLDLDFVSDEETSSVSEDSMSHDRSFGLGSDGTGESHRPMSQPKSDPNTLKSLRMFRPSLKRKKEDSEPLTKDKKVAFSLHANSLSSSGSYGSLPGSSYLSEAAGVTKNNPYLDLNHISTAGNFSGYDYSAKPDSQLPSMNSRIFPSVTPYEVPRTRPLSASTIPEPINSVFNTTNLSNVTSTSYVSNIIKSSLTFGVPKFAATIPTTPSLQTMLNIQNHGSSNASSRHGAFATPNAFVKKNTAQIASKQQGIFATPNAIVPKSSKSAHKNTSSKVRPHQGAITKNPTHHLSGNVSNDLDLLLKEVVKDLDSDLNKTNVTESKNGVAATLLQLGGQVANNHNQLIQVTRRQPRSVSQIQTKLPPETSSLSGTTDACETKQRSRTKPDKRNRNGEPLYLTRKRKQIEESNSPTPHGKATFKIMDLRVKIPRLNLEKYNTSQGQSKLVGKSLETIETRISLDNTINQSSCRLSSIPLKEPTMQVKTQDLLIPPVAPPTPTQPILSEHHVFQTESVAVRLLPPNSLEELLGRKKVIMPKTSNHCPLLRHPPDTVVPQKSLKQEHLTHVQDKSQSQTEVRVAPALLQQIKKAFMQEFPTLPCQKEQCSLPQEAIQVDSPARAKTIQKTPRISFPLAGSFIVPLEKVRQILSIAAFTQGVYTITTTPSKLQETCLTLKNQAVEIPDTGVSQTIQEVCFPLANQTTVLSTCLDSSQSLLTSTTMGCDKDKVHNGNKKTDSHWTESVQDTHKELQKTVQPGELSNIDNEGKRKGNVIKQIAHDWDGFSTHNINDSITKDNDIASDKIVVPNDQIVSDSIAEVVTIKNSTNQVDNCSTTNETIENVNKTLNCDNKNERYLPGNSGPNEPANCDSNESLARLDEWLQEAVEWNTKDTHENRREKTKLDNKSDVTQIKHQHSNQTSAIDTCGDNNKHNICSMTNMGTNKVGDQQAKYSDNTVGSENEPGLDGTTNATLVYSEEVITDRNIDTDCSNLSTSDSIQSKTSEPSTNTVPNETDNSQHSGRSQYFITEIIEDDDCSQYSSDFENVICEELTVDSIKEKTSEPDIESVAEIKDNLQQLPQSKENISDFFFDSSKHATEFENVIREDSVDSIQESTSELSNKPVTKLKDNLEQLQSQEVISKMIADGNHSKDFLDFEREFIDKVTADSIQDEIVKTSTKPIVDKLKDNPQLSIQRLKVLSQKYIDTDCANNPNYFENGIRKNIQDLRHETSTKPTDAEINRSLQQLVQTPDVISEIIIDVDCSKEPTHFENKFREEVSVSIQEGFTSSDIKDNLHQSLQGEEKTIESKTSDPKGNQPIKGNSKELRITEGQGTFIGDLHNYSKKSDKQPQHQEPVKKDPSKSSSLIIKDPLQHMREKYLKWEALKAERDRVLESYRKSCLDVNKENINEHFEVCTINTLVHFDEEAYYDFKDDYELAKEFFGGRVDFSFMASSPEGIRCLNKKTRKPGVKIYSNSRKRKHDDVPCFKLDQEKNVSKSRDRRLTVALKRLPEVIARPNVTVIVSDPLKRQEERVDGDIFKKTSPLVDCNVLNEVKFKCEIQKNCKKKSNRNKNKKSGSKKPIYSDDEETPLRRYPGKIYGYHLHIYEDKFYSMLAKVDRIIPRLGPCVDGPVSFTIPGLYDFTHVLPRHVDHVVNVVQHTSPRSLTVTNQNTQTSTQVTPHIQRIGQPKLPDRKPDHYEDDPEQIPSSSTVASTPSTSQSTLINILNSPKPGQKSVQPRQAPYVNILSQQILRPNYYPDQPTATVIKVEPDDHAEVQATKTVNTNVRIVTTTTQAGATTTTSSPAQAGTILQFICKSSSLPKFQQAFGKTVYQTGSSSDGASESSGSSTSESTSQPQTAVVETKKIAAKALPVNVQPIAGNVIFRGQVPVGQTVSLIPPGSNTRQLFRITGSTHEQISLVKETVIQNKMSALLAAALQGKPKITEQNGELVEEYSATRITLCRPGTVPPNATRIVKPVHLQIPANVIRAPQPNVSSTTLEQLREFDMVYKQVKERSSNPAQPETSSPSSQECPQQQRISFTYVNQVQKYTQLSPVVVVSSYSPIQQSVSPALSVTSQGGSGSCLTQVSTVAVPKVAVKSKGKSIKSTVVKTSPTTVPAIPKPQQKPQEDEHTTQRIFDILAEYAEQLRNSPDLNNKPAPRRRSNPPTNPSSNTSSSSSSKKKKKKSSSSTTSNMVETDNEDLTMGSEDSSGGNVVQLSMTDEEQSQSASITPPESNLEPATSNTPTPRPLIVTDSSNQPRNVIIADSSVGEALKMPNTALLMPGNYIMPVSVVKGGQQIAVVSGGSKILTTVPARSGQNMLLFQSFVNQSKKGGISAVKYSTLQPFSGISSQNIAGVSTHSPVVLPSNSVATVALGQPITLKKIEDCERGSNTELLLTISQPRDPVKMEASSDIPQPDSSTNLSCEAIEVKIEDGSPSDSTSNQVFNNIQKTNSVATSVIASVIKKEKDEETGTGSGESASTVKVQESPKQVERIGSVLVNASASNGPMLSHTNTKYRKPSESVESTTSSGKEFNHNPGKAPQPAAKIFKNNAVYYAIRTKKAISKKIDSEMQKQAAMERELRLQKTLSEECEDLGVDEPSTSDLFPEADLLFDSNHSPSYDQSGQRIQGTETKAKDSMHLFSDDENSGPLRNDLFDYVEYHPPEPGVDQMNGNNVSNESPCDDSTLLSNCGTMSEVTLNSPISPEYSDSSHAVNKYKYKYTNRKKGEKVIKLQPDTWQDVTEVTSSEDIMELVKEDETPIIAIQEETVIEEAVTEMETVVMENPKSSGIDLVTRCPVHGSLDNKGTRRTMKKTCSCFNGSRSPNVSNAKKRFNSPKSQGPSSSKKLFLSKKR